jgi:DNA-binding winged helix-turn-helix (wHTH) protein/tetratricopeptide (TPR) repeat protein
MFPQPQVVLGPLKGMMLRFAGFELDRQRAELRRPDGEAIKLRPKTFGVLNLLAANAGRVLSKQELMDAVWPNVHVGDDSLFQCIREIRTALGDDQRQLIKVVSGRGYLFTAEVLSEPAAIATTMPGQRPPAIVVMPIAAAETDGAVTAMAANVTTRLADGLAKIENIRVSAPQADFVVSGELEKTERSWEARVRMTRSATGDVVWTAPVSVELEDTDVSLQQSRLTAGIGHPLALRIGALLDADARPAAASRGSPPGSNNVVIEQATASIMQVSRERFATAQTMLEKALAGDPDNVDLAASLAALQLRGIQMVWYSPAECAAAQTNVRSILERALQAKPHSIPVLEAYCRFLNATNEFAESLVACARTLNFDPWNGLALYHLGLGQIQLGRFEDALATFKQADSFDTPQVSRWTWRLGAGWTYLLMGRSAEALPWLQGSIAITPASGRSYMLLAAAYEGLGQPAEARAAMDKALALRPGSNLSNVALPRKNASPLYLAESDRILRAFVAAGLPER